MFRIPFHPQAILSSAAVLAMACSDSTAPSTEGKASTAAPATQSPNAPASADSGVGAVATPMAPNYLVIAGPAERCYQAVTRSTSRYVPGSALSPTDFGFQDLYTRSAYALVFKGILTRETVASTSYWIFKPQRFAIAGNGTVSGGLTLATSGGNPYGQALGSTTVFRFYSTKSSVSYSVGLPWSAGVSWENSNYTRRISNSNWEPTATSATSGVLTWQGGLTGNAGGSTGLYKISFQTGVMAGGDGPYYYTSLAAWNIPSQYLGTANAATPSFAGLYGPFSCSAVRWTN